MIGINEEYVKNVLGRSSEWLRQIHTRILLLYEELMDTDSLICSISVKRGDSLAIGSSGNRKALDDVVLKHERLARERELSVRQEMMKLTIEEECINRILICYQALSDREYTCLEQLYVQHLPYKIAEANMEVSHGTFLKIRKRGINRIMNLYKSDLSNREIMEKKKTAMKKYR